MDSRFISSHQCISECLNNYQQLISLQILSFFFNQKLPMGTVTYKVAGLFDTLLVCCCCCFVVEKSYVHIFFTSPKKNQKHSIRFWYFFKSIFLLETTFILLRHTFVISVKHWETFYISDSEQISETLLWLQIRLQSYSHQWKYTVLCYSKKPVILK